MIERLRALKSKRGQFSKGGELLIAIKKDDAFRAEIGALSEFFLGRKVEGCSNCYMDAFFELIHLNEQTIMDKANTHFHLLAGVLLQDVVNHDFSKNMTNANISDDLALYHLRTNKACLKYFDKVPDNLDELLGERVVEANEPAVAAKKRTTARTKKK